VHYFSEYVGKSFQGCQHRWQDLGRANFADGVRKRLDFTVVLLAVVSGNITHGYPVAFV
jgi:hypothetical protein